jgi:4-hydroxybenzoate polyprenyltransferase
LIKRYFQSAFDLFLFSSLFISGCAVVMLHQTVRLLHLPLPPSDLYAFVFWATMTSYNFHYYLTPSEYSSSRRLAWSGRHKRLELRLFLFSGLFAAYYAWFLHPYWVWIGIGVFLTFLYTAPKIPLKPFTQLRRLAVGKTLFLACVWTYITTLLPVAITGGGAPWPTLLVTLHRFGLIYAICIVFDYRDRKTDKEAGIRSLITYLDEKGIDRLFYIVCTIALISTGLLLFCNFSVGIVLALLLPILITMLLYPESKKDRSDYLYYFVLDGLMAFSACFTLFL